MTHFCGTDPDDGSVDGDVPWRLDSFFLIFCLMFPFLGSLCPSRGRGRACWREGTPLDELLAH